MTAAAQMNLFAEHIRPTKRARFVCREILPDALHYADCHDQYAQAIFVATTRIGELGCCCRSLLVLQAEGLTTAGRKYPAHATHDEMVGISLADDRD